MFCKECGRPLKEGGRFCPKCVTDNGSRKTSGGTGIVHKKKKWIPIVAALLVFVIVAVFAVNTIRKNSATGSPENAIEAYYQLLADGDYEAMADLVPKEKQKIFMEFIEEEYDVDYDDFEDLLEEYGEYIENHTGRVEDRNVDFDGYRDYGYSIWKELVPGLEDYEIYECGSVSVRVKDEDKADLTDLLHTICNYFDKFYDFRDEDDLLEEIEDAGTFEGYDSEDVIDLLSYDKLVECKTTIKPKSGGSITQDVYAYKVNGKWYCANILVYLCSYINNA
ncbi:MAG: zinc ribbon domain-containing protein [Ruminococcus sp.]|nr:zinc ribbon domain-containing protein [Ruminococcus sp.]